ncbi:MAG: T9SS type A sorting domain-containing protein, partial [Candidatus Cloacimonetes bacterium]|nr:T9SS type A sorting domain-containing protein [Candidatus Cloacimonadota bacterium]
VNPGELVSGLDFEMDEIHPGNVKGIVSLNGDGLDPEIVNVEISADGIDPVYPYLVLNLYYEYDYELAPGIYDITAHLAGYLDSTHDSVVVQPMQTISGYDFDLQPITYEGHISGTVTLKNGPGNVEDVEVSVPGFDPVHPDSNGVYTLTIVNGTYDVTAFLEGYTQVTIPDVIVLPDQTTIGIDMTLLNWDIIDGTLFIMIVYATVTYDGTFLSQTESNQLGAFGPGGVSDCRGIAVWQEGNHPLWCTDYHYWSLPGYWYFSIVSNNNSGTEIISFKVYNTETDSIYDCYETIIFEDCTDDNSIDFELLAPQTEQVFNLMEGWNWTSLNIIPTEAFIDSAFAPLGNNIYQIKSQYQSTTFLNGVWIGDLTHLTKGDAYLIYMIDAFDDFEISGSKINPIIYPIPLNPAGFGWNWIAYYPQVALSLEEALVSIEGNATVIKTQTQSAVYSDGIWQGDLLLIEPQVGYKIKIDNTLTEIVYLTYPGATTTKSIPLFVETMDSYANSAGWEIISGTKSNMIILAELIINNEIINNNYIAGVFDKNGNCRSIGRWENGFWYFTVVGNEDNEELHFRVYETENGILYESNEKITFINDSMIGKPENPIMITLKESTEDVLLTFDLRQNYPNPISNNLTSTISYSLPVSGYVHLAIYNIKGQLIETLVNNFKEPGDYSLKWDISKLNSGIYFYKLTFGDNKIIKRCLIMK